MNRLSFYKCILYSQKQIAKFVETSTNLRQINLFSTQTNQLDPLSEQKILHTMAINTFSGLYFGILDLTLFNKKARKIWNWFIKSCQQKSFVYLLFKYLLKCFLWWPSFFLQAQSCYWLLCQDWCWDEPVRRGDGAGPETTSRRTDSSDTGNHRENRPFPGHSSGMPWKINVTLSMLYK